MHLEQIIYPSWTGSPVRTTVLCLLLLSLNACSSFSWNPMNWFSDDEVNPPAELQDIQTEVNLRRDWSVNVGNGQGDAYTEITPTINGGMIFAASENGNIVAIEVSTGNTLWRNRLDTAITGGVGAGEGVVMVGTEEAEIVALDQATGEIVWQTPVSSEVLSQPQTNGDVVVAQTVDGKLLALDRETGEQRWIYETNLPALTLRGTSRPVITDTGEVIAGFSNGTLVSVAATDGVWRWEERVAVPEGQYDIDRVIDVDGDLLLDGNRVLATSYQGNLMAFDIATGRIVWGMEASSYHGMDQGFGNIYYSDDRSHLVAVRDNSNDVVWENEDLQYRAITAPTTINNYVAVADFEGYLHLISQIDGRIVGRTRIDDDGVRANLLTLNDKLYVYGNSGRLTALTLQ
ncbi:MAG TPA: outer membrane protein assembly factor BamB [Gammaproteobacteria bacterium]|jgi:outer membrane protein assembly factor BamB|nr:outer membrane protein assembly factor BamB [Gammaproteobacteria bacterium]MDP6732112.1 outer membrane protein assembly factor BamB [Gammaproteobacteria bacterium]HAJ74875.1 outer membrane protein assembly factor BamB [Gammaproteobacteria bacterium]